MGMVLDTLDRQLGPVASLPVLHVPGKGCRDAVDDPDVFEFRRTIDVVVLIVVDLEMDPELLRDPGDVPRILPVNFGGHLDHVAGSVVRQRLLS